MARRRRLVERFRPLRMGTGALSYLVSHVDERVACLAQDVRLFGEARERGLLDDRLVREARAAYAQQLAQVAVYEGQAAHWVREPLAPELRQAVVRLVGQVDRCRRLTQAIVDMLNRPVERVAGLAVLCQAIAERRLVQWTYRQDGVRIGAPHAHGWQRQGHEVLVMWQMAGVSRSGESVGWKTLRVADVSDVTMLGCRFEVQAGMELGGLVRGHCRVGETRPA